MLYLTLKKKRYALPTSWAELVPSQDADRFIRMCREMNLYELGTVHFEHFRIAMTIAILGLRNNKISSFSDNLSENLFRLGEQLSFPYRLKEQDGGTVCEMTITLSDNLIPKLHGTPGYRFHYDPSGRVDCDLTAERYIDALSLMQAWHSSRQVTALEALAKTLYPGLKRVKPDEAFAVYYNFRGILSWIQAIPSYRLIFTAPETDGTEPRKNPVGLASSIYSLSKAGYGPIDSVKDLPLFDYLDILLQQSIESIRTLAASNLKPTQIAERLSLPTDLVLEYTQ